MREKGVTSVRFFWGMLVFFALLAPAVAFARAEEATGVVFTDRTYDSAVLYQEETVFDFGGATAESTGEDPPTHPAEMPLLVNEEYLVADDYVPDDLVLMAKYCDAETVRMKGSKIEGQRLAVDALLAMLSAAAEDGVKSWQVNSGYRSVRYQQQMWDDKVYTYRKEDGMTGAQARAAAARYMARPGASEHHTGQAFDLSVPGEDSFSSTKQYRWLLEHCWDFGFIIRYTAEKKAITGINAEPWHIRYVGLPHAQIMRDTGQCLEEYLGVN